MSSINAEVRRKHGQRLERRAKNAAPRAVPGRGEFEAVIPTGSQRSRGASWRFSNRTTGGHWRRGTRYGENFGTIR